MVPKHIAISPERIDLNVERAYREFRGEPPDKPWVPARAGDLTTITGAALKA